MHNKKINIIDVTDLYHPYQDIGDNIDLITPFSLPEVNLLAVVLDTTERFRHEKTFDADGHCLDGQGPREPGIIPVNQLNMIFNKNVPYAVSPFNPMKSADDTLCDAPDYQQQGINLIIDTLRKADDMVDILVFSSLRAVAAAFNREPQLFHDKVRRIHISAGSTSSRFIEWNIALDPLAAVCVLNSGLPINLYPCANDRSPFELCEYNSFWLLDNMRFVKNMRPRLKSYLQYVFTRSGRIDFLRAMEEPADETVMENFYSFSHKVWETAAWLELTDRCVVKNAAGEYRIVRRQEIAPGDTPVKTEMRNCRLSVNNDGGFDFEIVSDESNIKIFYREKPIEYQHALNMAFGDWFADFDVF